jgi:hypothetical protein
MLKFKFSLLLLAFLGLDLINCKKVDVSKSEINDNLLQLGLLSIRSQRATITGKAIKGEIRFGAVNIFPLKADGTCDTSLPLNNTYTDAEGNYTITYQRTGGSVCVKIGPNPRGGTRMFDEKTSREIPVEPNSNLELTNIISESNLPAFSKSTANLSPFSSMMTRRLMGKAKDYKNLNQTDMEKLIRSSGKEVVIRFGLNRGFGGKDLRGLSRNLNDADFPDLNEIQLDFRDTSNPIMQNFNLLQASFSTLGDANKSGNSLSANDIASVLDAFSKDMEDGTPDGKNADGASLSINGTALQGNPISCGGDPTDPAKQKSCVMGGAFKFASEGGSLPGGVKIDTNSIKAQAQAMVAAETASIISSSVPLSAAPSITTPVLSYPSFTAIAGIALSITPINTGSPVITCSVIPTLPAGLNLASNCTISGTPTIVVASQTYQINAENSAGLATFNLSFGVTILPPVISTATNYTLLDAQSATIQPSLTGVVSNCYVQERFWNDPDETTNDYWDYRNYTLPYGLSINSTTCEISGIATLPSTFVNSSWVSPHMRIVAVNSAGTAVSDSDPAVLNNEFTITIQRTPAIFGTISNIEATQGVNFVQTITRTGSSPICSLKKDNLDPVSGVHNGTLSNVTLPTGLVFDQNTCSISGVPTATLSTLENLVIIASTGATNPIDMLSYSGFTNFSYSNRFSLTVLPHTFTIGGTLSGLPSGGSIIVDYNVVPSQTDPSQSVTITANGAYSFPEPPVYNSIITAWNNYEATQSRNLKIRTHPVGYHCIFGGSYYNAQISGTIGPSNNANITNMNINCYPKKSVFQPAYASFGGDIGGIAGADSKCNSKGTSLSITNSKALLLLAGVRQACSDTTSCMSSSVGRVDYPLQPSTIYVGKGGTVSDIPIFFTDANGTFQSTQILNFPSSTNMSFSHQSIWTGLSNANFSTFGDNTCGSWNYVGGGLAAYGNSFTLDSFLRLNVAACHSGSGSIASFMCLEQ